MPISLKHSTSVLAYIRYSPQANTLTVAGETGPREQAFVGKSFAVDIERALRCWLLISEGQRDVRYFPLNEDPPESPGVGYKLGVSVLFYAPKQFQSAEAFEMCSNTGAVLSFAERLFNEVEPRFGNDEVPIVRIDEAEPIKIGKGKSRELHFTIVKMIPRPQAFIDALAKLKAAGTTANKNAASSGGNGSTDDDVNDFDEGATSPKDKPSSGGAANDFDDEEPKATKAEGATTTKANKGRGKKAAPEHSSDILDDPIPFG
jgi:hypothetical protein